MHDLDAVGGEARTGPAVGRPGVHGGPGVQLRRQAPGQGGGDPFADPEESSYGAPAADRRRQARLEPVCQGPPRDADASSPRSVRSLSSERMLWIFTLLSDSPSRSATVRTLWSSQ